MRANPRGAAPLRDMKLGARIAIAVDGAHELPHDARLDLDKLLVTGIAVHR